MSMVYPFRLARVALAAAVLMLVATGCLERVDSEYRPAAGAEGSSWKLAGTIGGPARVVDDTGDPWEKRFAPGGFRLLHGIHVTTGEIWACDLGISRVQVFDYAGNHLRSYGSGVGLEGLLPTDMELYTEYENYDPQTKTPTLWQDKPGNRFVSLTGEYFKAADVYPLPDGSGFVIADQTRTGVANISKRDPGLRLIKFSGANYKTCDTVMGWPEYFATDGNYYAVTEPYANACWVGEIMPDNWLNKNIHGNPSFQRIVRAYNVRRTMLDHLFSIQLATNAGSAAGEFNHVGGAAVAYDKALICDTGNMRLQVFDARRDEYRRWGSLVRVIPARASDEQMRFAAPLDVDLGPDGEVFVLDIDRMEVAVLSPEFERRGAFGNNDFVSPVAVDVSPDGQHCFVSDQHSNLIYHYVRPD